MREGKESLRGRDSEIETHIVTGRKGKREKDRWRGRGGQRKRKMKIKRDGDRE